MRVSFSKESWNLRSDHGTIFTIFLFKMWKLCIICINFRIFYVLKKSGNQENPENSHAWIYRPQRVDYGLYMGNKMILHCPCGTLYMLRRGAFRIFSTTIFNWTFKNCVSRRGFSKARLTLNFTSIFNSKTYLFALWWCALRLLNSPLFVSMLFRDCFTVSTPVHMENAQPKWNGASTALVLHLN